MVIAQEHFTDATLWISSVFFRTDPEATTNTCEPPRAVCLL